MPRVIKVQTNFSVGEINPELRGRIDLQQYESALERARNVICKPHGSVERRPGLKYLYTIASAAAPQSGVRLIPFSFSTTQTYMLLFSGTRMMVFKEGVQVTAINGGSDDYLDVSSSVSDVTDGITSARLANLWYTQSADTLLLFEETMKPLKIVRGANHAAWTVSDITWETVPSYAFTLSTSNPSATLTPSSVSGNITLTAGSSVFASGNVGQYVENDNNFGRARITEYVSGTVVKAVTDVPFHNTDSIASGDWTLEAGYEDAWSSTRNWPRTATFHEGRLIVGGSYSLPSTVWGSRVGQYFNFDPGQVLDDEGMSATIDTNQVNAIVGVFSGRDLQIFTTGTEFICPQVDGSPLTPTSFIFKPMTTRGSKQGTHPVSTEGGTLYLQRGGKAIREFLFSDVEGSYVSNDISMLSSHLLQTPTRMSMRRGTNVDEGDLMLITNSGDGSIAAFSILRSQNVIAPSLFTTDGEFQDCQVEDADAPVIYAVVKRTLPNESTCDIVVSDFANIAVGSTIILKTSSGTSVTFTSAGSAGTSQWQSVTSNNQTATNLAAAINGHASFSASASTATVTVTRAAIGKQNLTVTSSDTTRLAATDFTNTEVYYLESFDNDHTTDCSIQYTATAGNLPASTTVSSLNFLEDQTVKVIADDNMLTDVTVASNQVTADRVATTYLELGLEYPSFTDTLSGSTKTTPLVRTMPVETRLPSGPVTGNKKRIVKANLILDNTQNIKINGSEVPMRQLGSDFLDQGITKFTGTKSVGPFLGYDFKGQIEITQSQPMFMTLLNLDYRVSVATD
tara:strand:+ start:346 stop:2733 length:2388 start_codon:yes stop_codon:yes gene_type:complete